MFSDSNHNVALKEAARVKVKKIRRNSLHAKSQLSLNGEDLKKMLHLVKVAFKTWVCKSTSQLLKDRVLTDFN